MVKDEAITLDKARELVGDVALWPRVRDFLWDFAPQVHESWIEGLGTLDDGQEENAVTSLASGLSTSPRVRRFILARLGIEPFFHNFPKDDWSRVALLEGATLLEIAKWLGALACAEELRRVTDGATVRQLKSAFRGIYPEVFSFTAYFTGLDLSANKANGAKLPDDVLATGLGLLVAQLDACPPALVSRLKFKFPSSLVSRLPDCGHETRDARRAGAFKKLLKLKFQEAYSLCCS